MFFVELDLTSGPQFNGKYSLKEVSVEGLWRNGDLTQQALLITPRSGRVGKEGGRLAHPSLASNGDLGSADKRAHYTGTLLRVPIPLATGLSFWTTVRLLWADKSFPQREEEIPINVHPQPSAGPHAASLSPTQWGRELPVGPLPRSHQAGRRRT